eukprot:6201889-Pleurochrysis_carterae.AAC.2
MNVYSSPQQIVGSVRDAFPHRVCGVFGTATTTKSDSIKSASSPSSPVKISSKLPKDPARRRQPIDRIPSAVAIRATSLPMPPAPTTPTTAPRGSRCISGAHREHAQTWSGNNAPNATETCSFDPCCTSKCTSDLHACRQVAVALPLRPSELEARLLFGVLPQHARAREHVRDHVLSDGCRVYPRTVCHFDA